MAYQVIARKYRPQRFSDVVGQEHVTRTLSQAIAQRRIAHAYLFCGPRGTGKTTIARIFAKCLNATGGPRVDFADDDPRCIEIAEGRSLDVLEIDAASNRGIEEIRGLREAVRYAPAVSQFKIYIIDEVHMLTKEAFNALLKTLEEPPEHVKFLFATTEPEKVLVTILSRCQRFDLRRIPSALIVKHLDFIAAQEQVSIEPAACYAIARGAEGAMRDAESTLDQLISFCGNKIVEADVLAMFGLAAHGQVTALAGSVLEGNVDGALRQLSELARSGKELGRLLGDLLAHFRNLLLYKIAQGDTSMLEVSESETFALKAQAPSASTPGLTRILELFGDAEMRLRDAASKRILLEVAIVRAAEARNAVSIDTVLERLNELRKPPGGTSEASPAPVSSEAPVLSRKAPAPTRVEATQNAPVQAPTPAVTAAPDANTGLWEALLDAVGKARRTQRGLLESAFVLHQTPQTLTIAFPSGEHGNMELVDTAFLEARLSDLGHAGMHVKLVRSNTVAQPAPATPVTEGAGFDSRQAAAAPISDASAKAAPAAVLPQTSVAAASKSSTQTERAEIPVKSMDQPRLTKEDFRNDPLIRAALDLFKGEIVQVKA